MMRRKTLVGAALLVLASGIGTQAAPRVEFRNNRLKVDGKPFFFYGCWQTPNKDYVEFRRHHFNTAFMSWSQAPGEGPKAAEAGLMVIPYPYAPGWSEKMKAAMQSIADKDWVLAWNIGDDLHTDKHREAALKVREQMRAIDPQDRPIMFDAIGQHGNFAKIPDMWCAYNYPLVKSAMWGGPSRAAAGLQEYEDWLREQRLVGRPDCFFWTWTQCHVQTWYSVEHLGGTPRTDHWRPSRYPDGDHLRLIAAHAISAGVRGFMWFVNWYFEDGHIGRDRYARAAVIGCELDIVGPLIAQGTVGERLNTSNPSVQATPIDFPAASTEPGRTGGRLICLLKTGDWYQYQPDAATARDVHVTTGATGRIYQIGREFKELSQPKCSFDLTGWLLVTSDDALVEELRRKHSEVLPDMAGFAVEELEARLAKVKPLFRELATGDEAIREADQGLTAARQALAAKEWTGACRLAEAGIRTLRTAQRRAWQNTFTVMESRGGRLQNQVDFYLLPMLAKEVDLWKRGAWGPNRLPNGSFETDEGWGRGAKLGHGLEGKATLLKELGRNASRAVRLMSEKPCIYKGEPADWVTVNVVSEKIPAQPGQIWEIAAWVRVPKKIEQTERGVTITLYAYGPDGKPVSGYGYKLETARVDATDGWQQLRASVSLRASQINAVAARLALCGVGEAYLDDVTVRRLELPPNRQ